jgi:ATP-dependent DNA ligase
MKEGTLRSFTFTKPMNALPVEALPEGDWLYEVKFDGYRALAFKDGKDVSMVSRVFFSPSRFVWYTLSASNLINQ